MHAHDIKQTPIKTSPFRPDLARAAGRMSWVPLPSRLYRGRAVPVPPVYHVDGYRRARAFIVTERPGPGASSDGFWRLLWERAVTTAVSIGANQVGADIGRLFAEIRRLMQTLLTDCV